MPDEEKRALADFVIENDGTRMVIPQVVRVDGEFRIRN
jgi:dephospho-CoA kinase